MSDYYVKSGETVHSIILSNYMDDPDLMMGGGADYMIVYGTAIDTWVEGGSLTVYDGGVAKGITVNMLGSVDVFSGGKFTGTMTFEPGASIYFETGSIFDFDLTTAAPGEMALVNGLSLVQGAPTFTLTVDGTLEYGNYVLAGGADAFGDVITIQNTFGEHLGMLTPGGESVEIDDRLYALGIEENDLILMVADIIVAGTEFDVFSGDSFENIVVSGGAMTVHGGSVDHVTIFNNGYLGVSSGGTATNINASPEAYLDFDVTSDTLVTGTIGGSAFLIQGGKVSDFVIG